MKKLLLLTLFLIPTSFLFAQLNMTLKSHIQYNEDLNDVWGYVAPDGREYAMVGARNGVSIVDVTDPENTLEVGYATGPSSTWRDIKVYKDYAYVTNEEADGLLVIDLSNLPNNFTTDDYYYWAPVFPGAFEPLGPCHNIFIDEKGFGYLIGCGPNNGGVIFLDLDTNPGFPEFIGFGYNVYSHDVFVRNDTLWSSDIYEGVLSIHDVSDKLNPQLLATQATPFDFTHNAWVSDDGKYVFTTDEVGDAPVAVYDVSELDDIEEVDQFRPLSTIGEGVLPHNVFVWNQWLVISYYTDGCILVDAQRPENLIEVGNFDTVLPGEGSGAWGVYPFLPSGTVLVTDIENGLYVLEPNYVEACFLEGRVTNAATGNPLNNVYVDITDSGQTAFTNSEINGAYKTGQAIPGTFGVSFSLPGYYPQTIDTSLINNVVTILDVALEPLPNTTITTQVVDATTGQGIANAFVELQYGLIEFNQSTDPSGNFDLSAVTLGDYVITAGAWGYQAKIVSQTIAGPSTIIIELDPGYEDDFYFDFEWTVDGNADAGIWEKGVPNGTEIQPDVFINPGMDVPDDLGEQAFVTGNMGTNFFDDDVDNGLTRLTSPVMDLTTYSSPVARFSTWFYNGSGTGQPNDALVVKINNGITESVIFTQTQSGNSWNPETAIVLSDFIAITDNMQIIFEADDVPAGHVLEAAIDKFSITNSETLAPFTANNTSGCVPFTVEFSDPNQNTTAWNWTFEGGIPETSTAQNPTVVFTTPGTHEVNLIATTSNGAFTLNQPDFITVAPLPTVNLQYSIVNDSTVAFSSNATNASNFSWNFGDGSTSTEENPTYVYSIGGLLTVSLVVSNECGGAQSAEQVLINLPTSTEELSKQQAVLSAHPNPFNDQIYINFDLAVLPDHTFLKVYNLMGQLVENKAINQSIGQIQVGRDLAKGIYFLALESNGKTVETLKLIKQ